MKKPAASDLLEAIRASLPPEGRPQGTGWYTQRELAMKLGVHYTVVMTWVKNHDVDRAGGTMIDARGQRRRVTYYRLKNGKAK